MNLHVKTILVVDDEPILRTIVREILHGRAMPSSKPRTAR